MADYFNYGFTEETWVSYCDRQRRLRVDNNLARLNGPHVRLFNCTLNFIVEFFC